MIHLQYVCLISIYSNIYTSLFYFKNIVIESIPIKIYGLNNIVNFHPNCVKVQDQTIAEYNR